MLTVYLRLINMKKDEIFADPANKIADFKFDEQVADVFDDMINRSVPGYREVVIMSGLFAERFVQPNSNCYDLGCSLGATTLSMRQRITQSGCRIIAVDNSAAMIEHCRSNIVPDEGLVPVDIILEDIRNIDFSTCSMAVVNYTLQFLPPSERQQLLQKIYDAMLPGAVLLLSEKVTFEEAQLSEMFIDIYHAWKAHNGYSELEIKQKRNALENILIPDTIATHRQRLADVGFKRCEIWFQCFNFISIAAFK
jgi:tRNA (cmo5U34)-methyltransferase